ncbi:MAG TPA: chemotaxis protein CheA [Rhabdaerophilum sp.]|nr:chemotaxis protein CheA [Rhabdaerophilum sp.]
MSTGNEFEQFRKTFFEECQEILSDLDGLLATLAADPSDRECLNAIFRGVHSIKAGAGAFSFARLVGFSHNLEAALDGLRDGRIAGTDQVTQLLVRAVDTLAAFVEAAQCGAEPRVGFGEDLARDLLQLMEAGTGGSGGHSAAVKTGKVPTLATAVASRFHIRFKPHWEMFRHANEPLLVLRELRQLGACTIACDISGLPAFNALDPEESYLCWQIEIETTATCERIAEVFEFVEDDCDLLIEPAGEAVSRMMAEEEEVSPPPSFVAEEPAEPTGLARGSVGEEAAGKARGNGNAVSSIRVELARVDRLVNMVGELVITQSMLAQQIADLALAQGSQAVRGQEDLAMLTRELQECVMAIRMQPVKSVFARMPRLVREVSAKLGKPIRLAMSGEQTEVDKTVIEELADPLTHMIRNAIDHGIESPEVRRAAGKPEEGTIELTALHAGSNILIHVADDGGGIDRDRLFRKAVEKGIVPANAKLGEEEIDELLFSPGFSTAEKVTDVSGRGVGMDVVRRNIVKLGGRIQVQSTLGKGTRFTLVIPLTLAVLDGMIVAVGTERYILPLTSIIESYRPHPRTIRMVTGGMQVASVRGEYVRLVHLHDLFGVAGAVTDPAQGLVVLVETAQGNKIGVVVDELIGQQQVVIKSLTDNFDPVRGISGATILGNGRVALILDIEQLTAMPSRSGGERLVPPPVEVAA